MDQWLPDVILGLLAISFLVAVFGALSAFSTARWIAPAGRTRVSWLLLSAVILGGCTAWAPHFLGLLAVTPDTLITFDGRMTLLAFLAPVAAFIPGLYLAYRWGHIPGLIPVAAVFIGAGFATLNYLGATAIRVEGRIEHDEFFLFAGVAVAVVLVIPAIYLARSSRAGFRYLAAPIMGLAVLGMYMVSMSGFAIVPQASEVDYFTGALTPPVMLMLAGLSVLVFSVLSLTLGLSQSDTGAGREAEPSDGEDKIERARQEIRRRHQELRDADDA